MTSLMTTDDPLHHPRAIGPFLFPSGVIWSLPPSSFLGRDIIKIGLKLIKQWILNKDILKAIYSPITNIPILPVPKPDASYCLAQDLGIINMAVLIDMMVPNLFSTFSYYYFYTFTLPL